MCGMVGIVGLTRPVDVAALQEMNDRQRHRGPDGEGFLLAWPKGGGGRFRHAFLPHTDRWDAAAPVTLGLGHRRLAILDLSDRGLQPLTVGDSDVWIAFNGEIYNHQELRAELQTLGHCFTTRTDPPVELEPVWLARRANWRVGAAGKNGKLGGTRMHWPRELLLATTRRQRISDGPVGSCLTGGLDSSTVVSLIGKIWREQPDAAQALGDCFNTFTACYEQREVDEREYALAVAHSVGANPHLVFPAPDDFLETFARMAWHQDMPFGEVPYYAPWRVMRG